MIPVLVTHKFKLTQLVNASKKMQTIEIFYTILLGIVHTFFYKENYAEIFPVHYTCKVAEKGFNRAFMINKLAMIKCFEIILEK